MFQEINEDVVTQVVGTCEERPSAIHVRHFFDELSEVVIGVQHENVYPDVFFGGSSDLFEC